MRYHLFPRTVNDDGKARTIADFDEYKKWQWECGIRDSVHSMMIELVYEACGPVAKRYKSLFDLCMNARYVHYAVDQKSIAKALRNLQEIHDYCDKGNLAS
jgi:hypothetical protein